MQRLIALIAATATAAAVAAAISLPAGADGGAQTADPDGVKLAACLRSHGLDVPADAQGRALKTWIGDAASRPEVQAALKACGAPMGEKPGQPPEELIACLRTHGLNPPSTLEAFKPWFVDTALATDAGKAAAKACGFETRPSGGPGKPGTCGDAVGPADGAKKPDDAKQPDTAATPAA